MKKTLKILKNSAKVKHLLLFGNYFFLFLYIFSIPSFSAKQNYQIVTYLSLIFLAFFAVAYTFLCKRLVLNKKLIVIPFFVSWAFLGTIIYSHEFRSWITLFLLMVSMFILYISFNNISDINKIAIIIVSSLFLFTLYFFIYYRDQIWDFFNGNYNRLGDHFDNVNTIGGIMIIGLIFSIYLSLFTKNKFRILFLLPISSFIFVGFLTGSRSFFICLLFIALVSLVLLLKGFSVILCISILLFLILIFSFFMFGPFPFIRDKFLNSMITLFAYNKALPSQIDTSTLQRSLWQYTGYCFGSQNIIVGYGCKGFSFISEMPTYTHGNFSELLCNFGIVGLFLYYFPYILASIYVFKTRNVESKLLALLIVFVLLKTVLTVDYYDKLSFTITALVFFCLKNQNFDMFQTIILYKRKHFLFQKDDLK